MTRVLVVEDEESFSDALSYLLRKEGFEVAHRGDRAGRAGGVRPRRRRPRAARPDAAGPVRHRGLPAAAARAARVPVIMLTAKDGEIDKVVGLELGADDYVTKPYSSRELSPGSGPCCAAAGVRRARARRRSRPARCGWTSSGTSSRSTGSHVALPLKEFELLELLLRNAGRVLTRHQLIDRVWGSDYVGDTKTLDVHVKRLRAKIEPDPADAAAPRHRARAGLQVRAVSPRRTATGCAQLPVGVAVGVAVLVSVGSGVGVMVEYSSVGGSTGTSTRAGPVAGVLTCDPLDARPVGPSTVANWTCGLTVAVAELHELAGRDGDRAGGGGRAGRGEGDVDLRPGRC